MATSERKHKVLPIFTINRKLIHQETSRRPLRSYLFLITYQRCAGMLLLGFDMPRWLKIVSFLGFLVSAYAMFSLGRICIAMITRWSDLVKIKSAVHVAVIIVVYLCAMFVIVHGLCFYARNGPKLRHHHDSMKRLVLRLASLRMKWGRKQEVLLMRRLAFCTCLQISLTISHVVAFLVSLPDDMSPLLFIAHGILHAWPMCYVWAATFHLNYISTFYSAIFDLTTQRLNRLLAGDTKNVKHKLEGLLGYFSEVHASRDEASEMLANPLLVSYFTSGILFAQLVYMDVKTLVIGVSLRTVSLQNGSFHGKQEGEPDSVAQFDNKTASAMFLLALTVDMFVRMAYGCVCSEWVSTARFKFLCRLRDDLLRVPVQQMIGYFEHFHTTQVHFDIGGFFTLSHSFILTIIGTALTYSIILIQADLSKN